MKRKACRISAALLTLATLLTLLLPTTALAEEGTGEALSEIHAEFSSNPDRRTALPLTLSEGDQLSINDIAIETELGNNGNPLISAGALATAATLSGSADASGRVHIPVKTIGELAAEADLKDILVSSDGRFISYPVNSAQGAGGTALTGEVDDQEGLSDKDQALLDAVRKGMNNPNYTWQELLDYVKQVMDNGPTDAYKMMEMHWGIPAETIKELVGDDNTDAFLDAWISNREAATQADMLGEYMKDRESVQAHLNINSQTFTVGINGQTFTLDINGQTFTLGVNGVTAATLAPTVWQDDLTPPPYHDPSYDELPQNETVLIVTGSYAGDGESVTDTIMESELSAGAASTDVPSVVPMDNSLQEVTVTVHTPEGTQTVTGLLYQADGSGGTASYSGTATDNTDGTWLLVWATGPNDDDLKLQRGFTSIEVFVGGAAAPTYTITNDPLSTLNAIQSATAPQSAPVLMNVPAPEAAAQESAPVPQPEPESEGTAVETPTMPAMEQSAQENPNIETPVTPEAATPADPTVQTDSPDPASPSDPATPSAPTEMGN